MCRENDSGDKVGSELGLTCDRLCRPEEGATAFISIGLGECPLWAGAVLGVGDSNTNRAISSHTELTFSGGDRHLHAEEHTRPG